ncbi:MAG: arylsulfatase, partial [Planctomycetota bacterium]
EVDGVSLMGAMRRPQELLEGRSLYWEFPGYGGQQALREGPWMLLRRGLRKGDPSVELYHLERDPSQKEDVAADHPERVARMLARMAAEHEPSAEFPLPGVDS